MLPNGLVTLTPRVNNPFTENNPRKVSPQEFIDRYFQFGFGMPMLTVQVKTCAVAKSGFLFKELIQSLRFTAVVRNSTDVWPLCDAEKYLRVDG